MSTESSMVVFTIELSMFFEKLINKEVYKKFWKLNHNIMLKRIKKYHSFCENDA